MCLLSKTELLHCFTAKMAFTEEDGEAFVAVVDAIIDDEDFNTPDVEEVDVEPVVEGKKSKSALKKEARLREKQLRVLYKFFDAWCDKKHVPRTSKFIARLKKGLLEHPRIDELLDNPANAELLKAMMSDVQETIRDQIPDMEQDEINDMSKFTNRTTVSDTDSRITARGRGVKL